MSDDVWCLVSDVWIKVITVSSFSKSCPILNLVLQTKPDDQDDQDDEDDQDNQDDQYDQDDQDNQDYKDNQEDQDN